MGGGARRRQQSHTCSKRLQQPMHAAQAQPAGSPARKLSQQALLPEGSAGSRLRRQLPRQPYLCPHVHRGQQAVRQLSGVLGPQPRAVLPHPVGRSSHGGMGAGREPGRVGALRRHPAGCEAGGGHSTRVSPPAGVCQDCFIPCLHRSHHHLTHAAHNGCHRATVGAAAERQQEARGAGTAQGCRAAGCYAGCSAGSMRGKAGAP